MARSRKDTSSARQGTYASLPPEASLLSNGRYNVLVTASGAGYASWAGLDVTRWREDGVRDCWGQFCYVRDVGTGKVWSIGRQPIYRQDCLYECSFDSDHAAFRCSADDIDIRWKTCVVPDCDAEVRLLRITNRGSKVRELQLTSYSEICLANRRADSAHPAFAKLFVETRFDPATGALIARRRPRSVDEKPVWAVHVSATSETGDDAIDYETDRYRFLGRGRTMANPAALEGAERLSRRTGPVLDPVFSLRRRIRLDPGMAQRIAFTTGAADNERAIQTIATRFCDIDRAEMAFAAAAQRHENELRDMVAVFNRFAAAIAFPNPDLRSASAFAQGPFQRDILWSRGISGDLPIALVSIAAGDDEAVLREAMAAQAHCTRKGLNLDLVIIDGRNARDVARLTKDVQGSAQNKEAGKIFVVPAADTPDNHKAAIMALARIVLSSSEGSLGYQLTWRPDAVTHPPAQSGPRPLASHARPAGMPGKDLQFWNGFGGFAANGSEYVVVANGPRTPTPWCNVLANRTFGCLTSESGLGFTWADNSQLNRLTPWSNDPVSDPPGEVVYLRDEENGEIRTPTPLPLGHSTTVRHGQGYTRYEGHDGALHHEMTVHVPSADSLKIVHLAVRNDGAQTRHLTATYFLEWVLGSLREDAAMRVACEFDTASNAVVARNLWATDFAGKLAFAAASLPLRSMTCDRGEFLGSNGSVSQPAGLAGPELRHRAGILSDPCAALMVDLPVAPGETAEVVFVLGQADNRDEISRHIARYAGPNRARDSLAAVTGDWDRILGAVTLRTPDAAFDLMMNRWLVYQTLACRIWARSAFYQSGGAYGFRDQLQDVMALVHCAPEEARAQILRAASRQFEEGDVQHWWHPPSGVGVRTRITDDLYFLPYVVHHYVSATGDQTLLDESAPFITAPVLRDDQEETFGIPKISGRSASLYEHCCRALEHGLRVGSHGLPLMGTGDWNDGMNRVGAGGKGESVWNGWFFLTVLGSFATLASARGDDSRALWCRENAEALRTALEANAWDGGWYRRAYFDNGIPLGSASNSECQIDAIPQAWAVISGAADDERASTAMKAVWDRLVSPGDKLIKLFDPPFDRGSLQPGYIKGYVPGIRENGGQYTHAATWVVWATALLGDGDRAFALWNMLNPITHAETKADAEHYKVEPYVVSADVYGASPNAGRGGWTWYTGSAGWLYRVGLEAILGIRRRGQELSIEPCIPAGWPGYELDLRHGSATYRIKVVNNGGREVVQLTLDGQPASGTTIRLEDDSLDHEVQVVMGPS